MPHQHRVSALIVTYQQAAFIGETIASVLGQDRQVDEIVVVDDGSTDGTVAIASSTGDPRVRVITLPHRGVARLADTYNAGLEACSGDVIAFCEGDDRWPADKLTWQLRAFDDERVVLSHGRYSVIGARGTLLHRGVSPHLPVPEGTYDALPLVLKANYIMDVTAAVRASALSAMGGFQQLGMAHCDYATYLGLAEQGPFHYQARVLGEWRRHGGSLVYRQAAGPSTAMECAALAIEIRGRSRRADLPSTRAIEHSWLEHRTRHAWGSARAMLIGGRYREARRVLMDALRSPASVSLKLRLILGIVAAILHVNVEGVARLAAGRSVFSELER